MNKTELIERLQDIYPGQEITIENRPNMISDHWFICRRERDGASLEILGNDFTELKALKNAVAVSEHQPVLLARFRA